MLKDPKPPMNQVIEQLRRYISMQLEELFIEMEGNKNKWQFSSKTNQIIGDFIEQLLILWFFFFQFSKLARDLVIPTTGTSGMEWGPSPGEPVDEVAEAAAQLAGDDLDDDDDDDDEMDLL